VRAYASRALLLLLLWWILSDGEAAALPFGVPAALLLALLLPRLFPAVSLRIHWLPLLRFGGLFLRRSVVAGLDVAARLLAPVPRIAPLQRRLRLQLPPGPSRWLLANTLSLLPGTLTVALQDDDIVLHCLDEDPQLEASLRELERHIGAVFGVAPDAT